MRRRLAASAAAALLIAGQAAAATPACRSPSEVEADQAMLFKTSLMLISETCSDRTFSDFEVRDKGALLGYQKVLIDMYKRHGDRRGESTFETYMTHLANLEAIKVGAIPVQTYCASSKPTLQMASTLSDAEFRHYAADQAVKNRDQYTLCR